MTLEQTFLGRGSVIKEPALRWEWNELRVLQRAHVVASSLKRSTGGGSIATSVRKALLGTMHLPFGGNKYNGMISIT